jgi:hypothetical protein
LGAGAMVAPPFLWREKVKKVAMAKTMLVIIAIKMPAASEQY